MNAYDFMTLNEITKTIAFTPKEDENVAVYEDASLKFTVNDN